MAEHLTEEYCLKNGYDIITFPLNKQIKMAGCLLCALAVFPLLYVQQKYIFPTSFNLNIKIILIGFFANATTHSVFSVLFLLYQCSLTFGMTSPCDIFLPRELYIFAHITNFYLLAAQNQLLIAACIERAIATAYFVTYAKKGPVYGVVLTFLAFVTPVPWILLCYWDENFQEPRISYISSPPHSAPRLNLCFVIATVLVIACLMLMQYISIVNARRKRFSRFKLSSQFQSKENLETTQFITIIMILQISITILFNLFTVALRLLEFLFIDNMPLYHTLKATAYVLPIYFFILPFLSIYLLSNRINKGKVHCAKLIGLASKGKQGIQNYSDVIYSTWQ